MKGLLFICLYIISPLGWGQEITLVRLDGSAVEDEAYLSAKIAYTNDSTLYLEVANGRLHIDSSLCTGVMKLWIEPSFGQPYYNEFLCEQLNSIDTIRVNQTRMIKNQTPRLLLGGDLDMDTVFSDQLWVKQWLEDYPNVANGVSFLVYNADRLTIKDKRKVKQYIVEYCDRICRPEFANEIEYGDEPYPAGQQDAFNEGTAVTHEFIESQNTNFMKSIARKYSLVVVVVIEWKRE